MALSKTDVVRLVVAAASSDEERDNLLVLAGTQPALWEGLPEELVVGVLRAQMRTTGAGTGVPTPASQHVQQFWQQLPNAREADGFLRLAGGTSFVGDARRGDTLMVRTCYMELYGILRQHVEAQGRFVLTGNPGIGKTLFGHYLLYKLAVEGSHSIVWESRIEDLRLWFSDGSVMEGRRHDFNAELHKEDTWYIVDGVEPVARLAKTVLLTSPKRETYKEFLKLPGATICYMPVWSQEEILACRSAVFPNLAEAAVLELFDRWGGVPRYVLEKALLPSAQALLMQAINAADLHIIKRTIGQPDTAAEASHRILHIDVQPDYITTSVKFASSWVGEQVAFKLYERSQSQLREFLISSSVDSTYAGIRGLLWEGFCHQVLASGGNFCVRDLHTGKQHNLMVPSIGSFVFADLAEVNLQPNNVYCRPKSQRLAAIDALMQPNLLFQITVSSEHGIHADGLKLAVQQLHGSQRTHQLIFVVPPDIFPSFSKQAYKRSAETQLVPSTKQYVMQVNIAM